MDWLDGVLDARIALLWGYGHRRKNVQHYLHGTEDKRGDVYAPTISVNKAPLGTPSAQPHLSKTRELRDTEEVKASQLNPLADITYAYRIKFIRWTARTIKKCREFISEEGKS